MEAVDHRHRSLTFFEQGHGIDQLFVFASGRHGRPHSLQASGIGFDRSLGFLPAFGLGLTRTHQGGHARLQRALGVIQGLRLGLQQSAVQLSPHALLNGAHSQTAHAGKAIQKGCGATKHHVHVHVARSIGIEQQPAALGHAINQRHHVMRHLGVRHESLVARGPIGGLQTRNLGFQCLQVLVQIQIACTRQGHLGLIQDMLDLVVHLLEFGIHMATIEGHGDQASSISQSHTQVQQGVPCGCPPQLPLGVGHAGLRALHHEHHQGDQRHRQNDADEAQLAAQLEHIEQGCNRGEQPGSGRVLRVSHDGVPDRMGWCEWRVPRLRMDHVEDVPALRRLVAKSSSAGTSRISATSPLPKMVEPAKPRIC